MGISPESVRLSRERELRTEIVVLMQTNTNLRREIDTLHEDKIHLHRAITDVETQIEMFEQGDFRRSGERIAATVTETVGDERF